MCSLCLPLEMTQSGFCVTAPPYTVGESVPFTAGAMGKETPLQSSEMVRTCSEDTRIFPGAVILKFLCYLSRDNNTDTYAVAFINPNPPPPHPLPLFPPSIRAGSSKCTTFDHNLRTFTSPVYDRITVESYYFQWNRVNYPLLASMSLHGRVGLFWC